jgi:hypothetical protein
MNASENTRCAEQAGKIAPILVWSGLGLCAAAATLYDLRDIVGW